MRWQARLGPADGIVAPGREARDVLEQHRLTQRSFSPTALQQYAACPYRFLLYSIHRLRPREEVAPLERIDPLTRGSLFHEVQHELFVKLRDEEMLPITPSNRDAVVRTGDRILDVTASRYEEQLAPAIPRVWEDEIEGIRTDLRGWIHSVADAGGRWVPAYSEFSFGLGRQPGRDPLGHHEEAVVDGYRLRG
jgi:ATP-dependent helicase/DNAse subunit B